MATSPPPQPRITFLASLLRGRLWHLTNAFTRLSRTHTHTHTHKHTHTHTLERCTVTHADKATETKTKIKAAFLTSRKSKYRFEEKNLVSRRILSIWKKDQMCIWKPHSCLSVPLQRVQWRSGVAGLSESSCCVSVWLAAEQDLTLFPLEADLPPALALSEPLPCLYTTQCSRRRLFGTLRQTLFLLQG